MLKRIHLGLLACLAATAPASAAEWDSAAGWDVYEIGDTRCVVGRTFAGVGTTFGIIMGLDGEVRVFATGAGWPALNGQPSAGQILLDGRAYAGRAVGMEQQNNRGFVAAATPEFLTRFATASLLGISGGPGTDQSALPLTGAAAGLTQGRRCLDALRRERSARPIAQATPTPQPTVAAAVQPAAAPVLARGPVARGSKSAWMADAEYPSAALRAEEQGAVTVKLAIDERGQVSACEVVKSSGSSALDSETCRTVRRRARYTPAVGTDGRAMASVDQHTVRWALPE